MRNIKTVLYILSVLILGIVSCKKDEVCSDLPRARIVNGAKEKVSVQIKTTSSTVNINNVLSGQTSNYESYTAGNVTFTVTIDKVSSPEVVSFVMTTCTDYDIKVSAENKITFTQTSK